MSDPSPLPVDLAIPSEKITKYLLNPEHPKGGAKARFFLSFGFTPTDVVAFADALFAQATAARIWRRQPTAYGAEIVTCIGSVWTPSGRTPWIRTVWLVGLDGAGTLVTAVPDRTPAD